MSNPFASPEYHSAALGSGTGNISVRLKRVGVLSSGVAGGAFGVLIGFIVGGFIGLISMAEELPSAGGPNGSQGAGFALGMGIGAVILVPIFYGIGTFIMGIIYAAIYNVIAGLTGGIEMEFRRN